MKNKMDRKDSFVEGIKNALVLVLLLLVTFALLEIPKKYYQNEDQELFSQVKTVEYSVNDMEEQMNLKQKLETFSVHGNICVTEPDPSYTQEELRTIASKLNAEGFEMLFWPWNNMLSTLLESDNGIRHGFEVQILRVIDNQIYSFQMGVIHCERKDYSGNSSDCMIIFDVQNNKILALELFGYYPDEEVWKIIENEEYYQSFLELIKEYYKEAELTEKELMLDFEKRYLRFVPISSEDSFNETFMKEIEELADKYLYEDYDEMIQE